jgi:hypothetical protein
MASVPHRSTRPKASHDPWNVAACTNARTGVSLDLAPGLD